MPPYTSQAQPTMMPSASGRVSWNPFLHIGKGFKNVVSTNLPALFVQAIFMVFSSLIGAAVAYGLIIMMVFFALAGGGNATQLVVILIGLAVVYFVFSVFAAQAFARVIVTGSRKQKISIGDAFKTSFQRLPQALLAYLLLGIVYVAVVAAIAGVSALAPVAGVLLGIVMVVVLVLAAFRISMLSLVLADDTKQNSAVKAIKRTFTLYKQATGAVVILILTLIALYIAFALTFSSLLNGGLTSAQTPDDTDTSQTDTSSDPTEIPLDTSTSTDSSSFSTDTSFSDPASIGAGTILSGISSVIVMLLIEALITTLIATFVLAGLGHIYNEALLRLDGSLPGMQPNFGGSASPLPIGPQPGPQYQPGPMAPPAPTFQQAPMARASFSPLAGQTQPVQPMQSLGQMPSPQSFAPMQAPTPQPIPQPMPAQVQPVQVDANGQPLQPLATMPTPAVITPGQPVVVNPGPEGPPNQGY